MPSGRGHDSKALGLPYAALVTIVDSGHGPDLTAVARWLGARWRVVPSLVELVAVLGQNQAVALRDRTVILDTPAQWQAAAFGTATNIAYAEPGMTVANYPQGW